MTQVFAEILANVTCVTPTTRSKSLVTESNDKGLILAVIIDQHLGERIVEARTRSGLDHASVAVQIGIPEARLKAFEVGAERIPAVCIARLSRALDVSPEWFFKGLPGQNIFGLSA